jgi:hypothetical protein
MICAFGFFPFPETIGLERLIGVDVTKMEWTRIFEFAFHIALNLKGVIILKGDVVEISGKGVKHAAQWSVVLDNIYKINGNKFISYSTGQL